MLVFPHEVVPPEVFHRNGDLGQRGTHKQICAGEFMKWSYQIGQKAFNFFFLILFYF